MGKADWNIKKKSGLGSVCYEFA